MVPAHAGIKLQLVLLLIVQVHTGHLVGSEALATASPAAASAPTGEAHIIGIICIGHHKELQVVLHHAAKDTGGITVLGTCRQIRIHHHAFVHARLDTEVEHRLLLTVVDTRHTGQVALLVVGLDTVDDVGRQVLQGRLGVAHHELLTIHQDLLHLLTVHLDGTVIAHLCTGQTFHELFHYRSLRCTEGGGVIYEGIRFQGHLRGACGDRRPFQHDGIGCQRDGTGTVVLSLLDGELLGVGLEAHIGNLQGV